MSINTDKFKDQLNKFRDPKNYDEPVVNGALYVYEVKKLESEDISEYLNLYYKIYSAWDSQKNVENFNKDFIFFVNRDFKKYRPKRDHEDIQRCLDRLTTIKKPLINIPFLSNIKFSNDYKYALLILVISFVLPNFTGEWDGLGLPFTILTLSIFIFIPYTVYTWYSLNKKDELSSSERNKLLYYSIISVSLLIVLIKVSPHEIDNNEINCYKLANGETYCYSDRQFDDMLDKYKD